MPLEQVTSGVFDGMSEELYQRHHALSHSGAKLLLPPSCPALFRWVQDNGRPPKAAFDFGTAAHKAVLGVGAEIVTVDAKDWRTKAAQEAQGAAYADGKVPLLAGDVEHVEGMTTSLRQHPIASALLNPDAGRPEQSLFWTDPVTGVHLRARLDWLPTASNGRMILVDYKSTVSAEPTSFAKSCANYGYHSQAAWYSAAATTLGLAEDVAFVFIAQEKTPPYLVTVFELDAEALRIGRERNRRAIEVFRDCTEAGVWPGYSDDVALISLPAWAVYNHDQGNT